MTTTGTRKVLVAYASRNGGTAGIADIIAATLCEQGLTAEARACDTVRDISGYQAVVLGAALYNRQWHRDARRFVRRHGQRLRERPVWLFSSGPLDTDGAAANLAPVPGVTALYQQVGARQHVTFGGRLSEDAQGFIARMMARNGHGGDFRDPAHIAAWAREIAGALLATSGAPTE